MVLTVVLAVLYPLRIDFLSSSQMSSQVVDHFSEADFLFPLIHQILGDLLALLVVIDQFGVVFVRHVMPAVIIKDDGPAKEEREVRQVKL